MLPACGAPHYDERFVGYGKNKIQHVSHLRYLDFEFEVVPEGFVVHRPHPPSKAKENWLKNREGVHKKMDWLYQDFMRDLIQKYGKPKVSICPHQ